MSASQIPNLNSLRRGGGGGRGRFRGRGNSNAPLGGLDVGSSSTDSKGKDRLVQQTDNDASISRLSAVDLGYLQDPFATALAGNGTGSRRYPIINRGTYVRTTAIDALVERFLDPKSQHGSRKQIISLGAGSDTRIFRLLSDNPSLNIVYHELDFPTNTAAKVRIIRSSPLLLNALRISGPDDMSVSSEGGDFHSRFLHIHPIDLRTLSESSTARLEGIDTSLPTMIISECCLVYLSPSDAANVVSYFTKTLFPCSATGEEATTPLVLILYEPIRPNDPFGKTMVTNLAARGIQLQTLHRYASLAAQRERLREHGFVSGQAAADVDFIWEKWVSDAEKERVAELEMLDEVEEWKLLAAHYCVAWGWREGTAGEDAGNDGQDTQQSIFEGWKRLEAQEG